LERLRSRIEFVNEKIREFDEIMREYLATNVADFSESEVIELEVRLRKYASALIFSVERLTARIDKVE